MSPVAVAAEEAIGRTRAKASRLTRQRVRSAWLFMAPMLTVLALVAGWPLLRIAPRITSSTRCCLVVKPFIARSPPPRV